MSSLRFQITTRQHLGRAYDMYLRIVGTSTFSDNRDLEVRANSNCNRHYPRREASPDNSAQSTTNCIPKPMESSHGPQPENNALDGICRELSREDSLLMPAEWNAHQACVVLFPHNPQTFRLGPVRNEVLNVAKAIAGQGEETVILLVKDQDTLKEHFQDWKEPNIEVSVCPSDDTWVRDTGPTCCYWEKECGPSTLVGIDWGFNAWGGPDGGTYWPCDNDQMVATRVCRDILRLPCFSIPIIMEGGSFHTDGEGTLLVTAECLLNSNRNPHLNQDEITQVLRRILGVQLVIWLPVGLDADEDTNGHVDNFCCFVAPGHVVLAWTDDEENEAENYRRCRSALQVLSNTKDAHGRDLQVHKIPIPAPPLVYTEEEALSLRGPDSAVVTRQPGEKMAGSYVNFYISNKAVVVPQFGVPTDALAIQVLERLFPSRKIVGVRSREILLGGGNIHCITQQIPQEHRD
jgi:agmatine deiminase